MDVVLVGAGSDRAQLLELVSGLPGYTRESAAALLQALPQTVVHGLPAADAAALRTKLQAAGASVRLDASR
jgi:ribosomal protein L7/L12